MDLFLGLKLGELLTVIALIIGPISAVKITIWTQKRDQRRSSQERLFITLMAHRRSFPPSVDWVSALNIIDVVYADHPKVTEYWHALYDILVTIPLNMPRYNHSYLTMLSEMAQILGYKSLQQTDIDKFYAPQAHGDQAALNADLQRELLRVLKATAHMGPPGRTGDAGESRAPDPSD